MLRGCRALALLAVIGLSACATTQDGLPKSEIAAPDFASDPVVTASVPDLEPVTPIPTLPPPDTPQTDALPSVVVDVPSAELGAAVEPVAPEPILEQPDPFEDLVGWADSELGPALASFQRSCERLLKRPGSRPLKAGKPELGVHSDWSLVCRAATKAENARPFFESLFVPLQQSSKPGLLTGYYETELEVRTVPDATYSEPILTRPESAAVRTRPRSALSASSSDVIAYGKPIDVFFLHVQGSGRLHFDDGRTVRAGYAANNGKKYKSIGRVLIDRGELVRGEVSKARIEQWMADAGPEATRELMNQNPRYIFFAVRDIADDEGPTGAMQVPLTAMASVAVDPSYNPYGVPVWLETRLPRNPGDHQGYAAGLLAVTQDTGSAIKGVHRGDLYFGAGLDAGALAGVMKHPAHWTVLIPRSLAQKQSSTPPVS